MHPPKVVVYFLVLSFVRYLSSPFPPLARTHRPHHRPPMPQMPQLSHPLPRPLSDYTLTYYTHHTPFLDKAKAACWGSPLRTETRTSLQFALVITHPNHPPAVAVAFVYDEDETCFLTAMKQLHLADHVRRALGCASQGPLSKGPVSKGMRGLFVEGVAVHHDHRRKGLCRYLMTSVRQYAQQHFRQSYGFLYLTVESKGRAAQQCYHHAGYKCVFTSSKCSSTARRNSSTRRRRTRSSSSKPCRKRCRQWRMYDDSDALTRLRGRMARVMYAPLQDTAY